MEAVTNGVQPAAGQKKAENWSTTATNEGVAGGERGWDSGRK